MTRPSPARLEDGAAYHVTARHDIPDVSGLARVRSCYQLVIRRDEDTELEIGPTNVVSIPAGHDGWILGNEPCVVLDFAGMADYAKK